MPSGERRDRDVAIEFLGGFTGEVRGPGPRAPREC